MKHLLLVLFAFALYLPTLQIGFLTDDFLDAQTTFTDVPETFTSIQASGYRPLMSFTWAIDNMLWGREKQWGWHLTNLFILFLALVSLRCFLRLFVRDGNAVMLGLALFAFATPVVVSVAKMDCRTSIIPVIPLLWSMYFLATYSRRERGHAALAFSSICLLMSLFLKETALAIFPAFAALSWSQAPDGRRGRTALMGLAAGAIPAIVYIAVRVLVAGLKTGYEDSAVFGPFMVKNLLFLSGMVWSPWLCNIPARVLLPLFGTVIWLLPVERRLKVFLASYCFFVLLTVSNLTPRIYHAVPAVPAFALAVSLTAEKLSSRRFSLVVAVLFLGVFLHSRDEVKLIRAASDYLRDEIDRMVTLSEEIHSEGPLFISGVEETCGGYGIFWPGEYMQPIQYAGFEPGRFIGGTVRMWEQLLDGTSGIIVFLDRLGGYCPYDVSRERYSPLADSTVILEGVSLAGELLNYPSCSIETSSGSLGVFQPILSESVIWLLPESLDGEWFYDLASEPLWASGDENVLIFGYGKMMFTDRNIAVEKAIESISGREMTPMLPRITQ